VPHGSDAPDGGLLAGGDYLSVGQIYLYDNPLLKRTLELSDVKPLVVGHWGTIGAPARAELHLCAPERVIKKFDLDMFYMAGPGHVGPALVGNTYLEGSYSEVYPDISQDEAGLRSCSPSSRSRAEFPVMSRRRRRG
jgi:xylulose-5-phosphate/fructose-6-phosphate phosphoketolase